MGGQLWRCYWEGLDKSPMLFCERKLANFRWKLSIDSFPNGMANYPHFILWEVFSGALPPKTSPTNQPKFFHRVIEELLPIDIVVSNEWTKTWQLTSSDCCLQDYSMKNTCKSNLPRPTFKSISFLPNMFSWPEVTSNCWKQSITKYQCPCCQGVFFIAIGQGIFCSITLKIEEERRSPPGKVWQKLLLHHFLYFLVLNKRL